MAFKTVQSVAVVVFLSLLAFLAASFEVAQAQGLNIAVLTPCCGEPDPAAMGLVQLNTLIRPEVAQIDVFSGSVTIPSPSELGIGNERTADIRLRFTRAEADYAECFLDYAKDWDGDGSDGDTPATYIISIVNAQIRIGTLFKQFAGFCDVDLSTVEIEAGIPAVQAGDFVTAVSVISSVGTPFLQGVFVQQ